MTEDQGEIVPKPRLSLVAKYLIFSLLVFLATGALMHWRMGRAIEKSAFEREANRANAVTSMIALILVGENLDQGIGSDKFQQIQRLFHEEALAFNTVGINVWSASSRIVYSSRFFLVGKQLPPNKEMESALKGKAVYEVTKRASTKYGEWESTPNTMTVYVPLRLEGPHKVSGVYEAEIDIFPHLQSIQAIVRRAWLTLGAGFAFLYFSLFFIVRGASKTISRQQRSLEQAYETEKERAAELALLLKTSETISSSLNLAEILDSLAEQMVRQIGVTFCRILLLDRAAKLLTVHAAFPIRTLNWDPMLGRYFELDSLPLFRQVVEERQHRVLLSQAADQEITAAERNLTFAAGADAKSVLVIPIVAKEQTLGVISVGETRSSERSPLSSSGIALGMAMASHAAVAIENAMLFADRERAYIVTLETLVAALDAREHEVRDHSRRVAMRTIFLATQMGVGPAEVSSIYRGALLHDIGKIGISDSILLKNGPLTEKEWAIMKKHPEIGHAILKNAKFLGPAREMVLCHHERYNGSGYPGDFRGVDIPLGARIFAVIDALDAITYDRPYSRARPFAQARQEIIKCSGSQFDPEVVEAFLKIPEESILSIG